VTYAIGQLFEEIAYVAYHFHWAHEELIDLEHLRRKAFVREIAKINRRLNELAKQQDED
jgi:hypothetical protein